MIVLYVILAAFMGLALYGIFMPRYVVKKGRLVDARVISCEKKTKVIRGADQTVHYYDVKVDFYGLNGETIEKTLKREAPLEEGEVIRSRYLDKRDLLFTDADKNLKSGNRKGLWLFFSLCLFILLTCIAFTYASKWGEGATDAVAYGFGYFISAMFVLVGILGIKRKLSYRKRIYAMQEIEGVQIDYQVKRGSVDDPDTYTPVYQYFYMGEPQILVGSMSSNAKKYRTIGRKVKMLRDCETGEVVCKEDLKSVNNFMIFFGIAGIGLFCLLFFFAK